jgi:hypothetical protein
MAGATTLACGNCGAALSFQAASRATRTATCPYCACPSFVERPAVDGRPDPAFVLAFARDAARARADLTAFLHSRRWFADGALAHATVDDLRGVYLPAYVYSAVATTHYTATIGEHYTESETYETTDAHGKKKTETRTVTRTEHHPLSGTHVGYVTDVVVSASAGVASGELQRVEPFDLAQLRRYAPPLISGWLAEEFSRDAATCTRESRAEAVDAVGQQLRRFMPGDNYGDLDYRTSVRWESLDPILVPVWVVALRYREGKPPLRVLINGQTGAATGRVPLSVWKVTAAVIAVAAVIAALVYLFHGGRPS